MGEIDPEPSGDSDTVIWTTHITLDDSESDLDGLPINPHTVQNTFDTFEAAMSRAIAISNDPQCQVDYELDEGQDVNVKITQL